MGQMLCYYEKAGGELVCQFKEWWILTEIFRKDKQNWAPFSIHTTSLALLIIVWIVSFLPRRKDFSRCFVISILIPLTIMTLCRWIQALDEKLMFLCEPYRCLEEGNIFANFANMFVSFPEEMLKEVTQLTLTLGLMFFLFMVAMMGRAKELKSGAKACAPFLLALVLSSSLGAAINMGFNAPAVFAYLRRAIHVILANTLVLLIIIFCQRFSCYSSSQQDEEAEGVSQLTRYKRSLRLSAIIFSVFCLIPTLGSLFLVDFFDHYGQSIGTPSSNWQSHTLDLLEWLTPIFFTLSTICCLPRYRPCYSDRSGAYTVRE